jgi:NAD(P)-dependent dehydrogenase (short-subunit alcohol dehydrogenase family)
MPTILITGANRGLGLGLTKLYAPDGWRVLACCRDPAKAGPLQDLAAVNKGRVTVHRVDVEDHASIDALAKSLDGLPIDVLVNCAGYLGQKPMSAPGGMQEFGASDFRDWDKTYRINVIGPMKMCETFVENVAQSGLKKIINITSIVGSIGNIVTGSGRGRLYGYRATKAALNAITKAMSEDLRARGITVIPLHPGWTRTDMGGANAAVAVEDSVGGMKKVIDRATMADTGKYLTWEGDTLPW